MTVELRTARLVAEVPSLADHLDAAAALFGDPRVARWLYAHEGGRGRTRAEAEAIIRRGIAHRLEHGFGLWWWRTEGGVLVGRIGLQWTEVAGARAVEVGWALLPEHWGRGYATEAAGAAVEAAFGRHGIPELIAYALPDNRASLRVMERLGFEYDRDVESEGLRHVLYRRGPLAAA